MTIRNSPSWCGKRSASLWPTRTASKDWLLIYDGIPNRCDTYNFTHVHFIHVVMYIYNESVCPHYQCDQYTEYMYVYIQVNAWCYFFNIRNPSFLYEFMLFINDAKLMFYINLLLILRFKKSLVSCSLIENTHVYWWQSTVNLWFIIINLCYYQCALYEMQYSMFSSHSIYMLMSLHFVDAYVFICKC